MIVLLNGAFGIGKTTVARHVVSQLPVSRLFDPEHIGFVLQRLPGWMPISGRGRDDFQHMPSWRRWTIRGARVARWSARQVVVPMAFSDLGYLEEVRRGVSAFDADVRTLCLVAPLEVVRERLAARGQPFGAPGGEWVHRRARECCEAHHSAEFGVPIDTGGRSAEEVASVVLAHLT